jgi:hypothetical protein
MTTIGHSRPLDTIVGVVVGEVVERRVQLHPGPKRDARVLAEITIRCFSDARPDRIGRALRVDGIDPPSELGGSPL